VYEWVGASVRAYVGVVTEMEEGGPQGRGELQPVGADMAATAQRLQPVPVWAPTWFNADIKTGVRARVQ
jgi:hypothetical protein